MAHHFLAGAPAAAHFVFVAGPAASRDLALELAAAWPRAAGAETVFVDAVSRAGPPADAPRGVVHRGPAELVGPDSGTVFWRLGPLADGQLDDLDAVGRVPGADLPGAGRRRGLLWCVDVPAAGRWRPLVLLGRLAGALQTEGSAVVVPAEGAPAERLEEARIRAAVATDGMVELVALPSPGLPGARSAVLAGLPERLFPGAP